jgi:hypothetical protein
MIKSIVGAFILALALIGCAAGPNPQQTTSSVLTEAAAHPMWWRQAPESVQRGVYVSESDPEGANLVFEYGPNNRSNNPPRCHIPGQNTVTDIGSDALGNVYLPNGDIHRIYVRAPGCGHLIGSIDDPFGFPVGVAVSGSAIYVANESADVAVCDLTGCSSELTDPSLRQVQNVAVDSSGNVWASYYAQNFAISLIVWPHGAMPGRVMSGYDGTVVPGDLSFDRHSRLISLDSEFLQVHTFKCAVNSAICSKTGDATLHGKPFFGALDAANSDFQVTNLADDSIDVYAYPGFAYEYSYDRGLRAGYHPEGITQTPP